MKTRAPEAGARREAVVDLPALTRNISVLSDALGIDHPLVDLRASAYGHGLVAVARASAQQGVAAFRVSNLADALELRDSGVEAIIHAPVAEGRHALAVGRDIRILDDSDEAQDAADANDLGVGVYGLTSGRAGMPATRAVMTLGAEVVAVKKVAAGTGVSYGYTYRVPANSTLALVAIGYADGVPRLGSNTAFASLAGVAYPVVGRIAMDQLVLDVGTAGVAPGDTVTIFGDGSEGLPTAGDWARHTRRSPAAITAALGARVVRRHLGGDDD